MKNNDITKIIDGSQITDNIRKLMETEQICCDEHGNFDNELMSTLVELCESSGKIKPKNTVAILEELLLNSDFLPNTYFMNRYASCLTCSCDDHDEDYIQNAVHKLKLLIESLDEIDLSFIIKKYIECVSKLLITQEPAKAEQTILELKHFYDETDAWDDPDNIVTYKSALYDLHEIQCRAGDTQTAVETLMNIVNIVNAFNIENTCDCIDDFDLQ